MSLLGSPASEHSSSSTNSSTSTTASSRMPTSIPNSQTSKIPRHHDSTQCGSSQREADELIASVPNAQR